MTGENLGWAWWLWKFICLAYEVATVRSKFSPRWVVRDHCKLAMCTAIFWRKLSLKAGLLVSVQKGYLNVCLSIQGQHLFNTMLSGTDVRNMLLTTVCTSWPSKTESMSVGIFLLNSFTNIRIPPTFRIQYESFFLIMSSQSLESPSEKSSNWTEGI